MIVDGDMKGLDASPWITMRAVAGGADAGLEEAAKLFNIKMKEFTWSGAFVTQDRRPGRIEGSQSIKAVAFKDAGKGSFRDGKNHEDLGVRTALATQNDDLGFELRRSLARLAKRSGGAIIEALRSAGELGTFEPLAHGLFADAEGGGGGAQRRSTSEVMTNQFSSHERSECGISVHVVPEEWRGVASRATTSLPDHRSADNVLKHDT